MGTRYYLLLTGYVVSSLGNWIYRLTLPLLVLHLTGSALNAATVYILEYLPFLLLSLPGGVYADRFDRRRLLIAGDLAAAAITVVIGVLVTTGVDRLWPLYAAALLLGCVEPIYHPAFQSLLPNLVRDDRIEDANAWMQSGDNIVSLAGPVAAGLAVSLLGYQAAVYIDAGTFVCSAIAIALIRGVGAPAAPPEPGAPPEPAAAPEAAVREAAVQEAAVQEAAAVPATATGPEPAGVPERRSMFADLREGTRYVFTENRVLLAGAVFFAGTNFAIWLVQANFVYYLAEYRHLSATAIGVILSAQGVGALLGAAISARLIRRFFPGRVILGYTALAGATTLLLVVLRNPVTIGLVWGLLFGLSAVNIVAWFTLRQRIVPRHLLGRVVATTRMLAFASIPVAALTAGLLENRLHNVYVIFAAAGLLRLVMAAVGLRTPLGRSPVADSPAPTPAQEANVSG
jgi:MFS family permease